MQALKPHTLKPTHLNAPDGESVKDVAGPSRKGVAGRKVAPFVASSVKKRPAVLAHCNFCRVGGGCTKVWSFHFEEGELKINAAGACIAEKDEKKIKLAYAKEYSHLKYEHIKRTTTHEPRLHKLW